MSMLGTLRRNRNKKFQVKSNRVFLEPLEPRLLLDAVTAHWIGESGDWSDPTNWDIGIAPNNTETTTYQVVIDVTETPTIKIDQDITIDTLSNSESLLVESGTTTITQQTTNSGSIEVTDSSAQLSFSGEVNDTGEISVLTGTINLSNTTLTASGSSARVYANDRVTLSSTNLYATNGGILSLLGATSYTGDNYADTTIEASGAGSRIDLSHLETLAGGGYNDYSGAYYSTLMNVLSGGEVDLAGSLGAHNDWYGNIITVDDTGILGVSGITSLGGTTLSVGEGQDLTFSSTTELSGSSLNAGTDVTLLFPVASSLTSTSLKASGGGRILFPAATSYTGNDYADTTIEATGTGSRIDLSHLETLAGGGYNDYSGAYYSTLINGLSGGEVDLAGSLGAHNDWYGNIITVDDTGILGVEEITSLGSTTLTVGKGQDLTFSSTKELSGSSLNAGTGATLLFPVASSLTSTSLKASGGGRIIFPAATSYTGNDYADTTIEATGTGSRIDLSHLETLAGGGYNDYYGAYYSTLISVLSGGEVDLAGSLSAHNGGYGNIITVDDTGILGVAGITSIGSTTLNVGKGQDLTFSGTKALSGSILAAGTDVTLLFPVATSLTSTSLKASGGGRIIFPAATSYTGNNYADTTIQATGTGSRIDLSHLETLAGGGHNDYYGAYYSTLITVLSGGEVDLAGSLSAHNGGYGNIITVDDTGILGVAGITSLGSTTLNVGKGQDLTFSGTKALSGSILAAGTDVTLLFPVATFLTSTSLKASGGGRIIFPAATSFTGNDYADTTIEATGTGSRIDLSHLETLAGGGYNDYYGAYYSTLITVLSGGEVDLAGSLSAHNGGYGNIITVDDTGILGVAGITSLGSTTLTVGKGQDLTFSGTKALSGSILAAGTDVTLLFPVAASLTSTSLKASGGGRILFPVATSYTGNDYADTTIEATGAGSRIDLLHLETLAGGGYNDYYGAYYSTLITVLSGGEIDLAGSLSAHNGGYGNIITVDGTSSKIDLSEVSRIDNSTLIAANGAIWVFDKGWNPIFGTGSSLTTTGAGSRFVNRGKLSVVDGTLAINTSDFTNKGILNALKDGIFDFNGSYRVDDLGILVGVAGGTFTISGDLLGSTLNADKYSPQEVVRFDGSGTESTPQQLEVMSKNLGSNSAGFSRNFVYGTLELDNNTYLKLVDLSDNATGAEPEAVYTNSLIVPAGTTLDLNGLNLYTRAAQIAGTIVGGKVSQIPDSGPLSVGSPTPGAIAVAGELDEWTFFSRAGQSITVEVDTGSSKLLGPTLSWAYVELLDSKDNVLAGQASTVEGQVVTLDDVAIPADGMYRVRVKAPISNLSVTGNYCVTVWDVTPDESGILLNRQVMGEIENPYSVDRWTFSIAEPTQIRFDLLNTSSSDIAFDLTGPNGWTGFSDITADTDLITLSTPGSYTLTAHGNGGAYGNTYAFKLVETTQTNLVLGTPYNGSFAGSGQAQLFKIDVPESNPLTVVLDDSATDNVNELYLKFGSPPNRGDYDYCFSDASASDQKILAPMAYAGTWYVLVYSNTTNTQSAYTLTATAADVSIASITPDRSAATADTWITITGAGFVNNTTVELISSGGTAFSASSVAIDSYTRITATFAAGTVPADLKHPYSLRVTVPGTKSATLADCFTMKASGEAHLETKLIIPETVGRHAIATLYVEYANTGDVAMSAPILVLDGQEDKALLTLDQSRLTTGFWTSATPEGFSDTVQFLASGSQAGILGPGESGRVAIYFAGLLMPWDFNDTSVEFNVGVLNPETAIAADWESLKESMRPDYVQADAWEAIWANFTAAVGPTWGSYLAALDNNALYLDSIGEETSEITRLLALELREADALSPIHYLASATDSTVESPGLDIVFSRAYAQPISRRYEIGPLGRGWANNWQYSLTVAADDTVTITDMTGTPRIFQPDSRSSGSYLAAPGDEGSLTLTGSTYILQEKDGSIMAFKSGGKLKYVQDTNGNRINCSYTGNLLTSLTASTGQSLKIGYNGSGRIISLTDLDGRQTLFTYDGANEHLIKVQEYDGRITSYTYVTGKGLQREHALSRIEYADGTHRYFTYDGRGRLSKTCVDGGEEAFRFAYDSAGTVTATDAFGYVSTLYMDDWNTVVKATNPLGSSVLLTLDELRNLTAITDPAGHTYTFTYNSDGDLARYVNAMGGATTFTYTSDYHQLNTLTDANGNETLYTYDSLGNLTKITYDNGSSESWTYDALGQVTQWTNGRGQTVSLTWDSDGNLTHKTYDDGSHVDYAYDSRGNMTSATDKAGTTTFAYDSNDYLTRIDYSGGQWLAFTYDAGGRRAGSTNQLGHELHYHYDAAGRLSGITDESGKQTVLYAYDAMGRLSRKTLGNGVYTTYEYDAAGQLLHLVNCNAGGTVLSRFDYSYDSRGRRTSMSTSYGTWTYAYDDMGQLIHAVLDSTDPKIADQDLQYVYDAVGNRIYTIENGVRTDYTPNRMNQYTQVGDTSYTFDADGNLISETSLAGTITYSYDSENRLIAVHDGADSWTYAYDAFGQRIQTVHNGTETNYVIDPVGPGNVVGEYDTFGALLTSYDYGFGLLSQTIVAGITSWYTFDALGNTSELTDASGLKVDSYVYAPFGDVLKQIETVTNTFQFVGEWGVMNESNGLEFMRARYYDAEVGRFTQADPIGVMGGVNLYMYVNNDPLMFIDPLGFERDSASDWFDPNQDLPDNKRYIGPSGKKGPHIDMRHFGAACRTSMVLSLANPVVGVIGTNILGLVVEISQFWVCPESAGNPNDFVSNFLGSIVGSNLLTGGLFCGPSKDPIVPPYPPANQLPPVASDLSVSDDPNALAGPSGYGAEGYISPDAIFSYRIDFENESTATAPAQRVVISDQLDSDLDWSTFELTEIGFGDFLITVPAHSSHFESTISMTYNGETFDVLIEAGINYSTGNVYAVFQSIDPDTSLPPDVLIGFLPPEDGSGRGMGYIAYIVGPKEGLTSGTEIRNIALISFDGQPQIATNQVDPHDPEKGTDPEKEALNTIDAGTPTSAVMVLPATINKHDFLVSWNGTDDINGSGIASYDIYVSIDGADFVLWKEDIAETSATYSGQYGHTYAFYSTATDFVGHTETAPAGADAFTTVVNSAPVANPDKVKTREDIPLTISPEKLLRNDTDANGDTLSIVGVSKAVNGTVRLDDNGNIIFTPTRNFYGTASFKYTIRDEGGKTSAAKVTVTITPVNDAPVAKSNAYTTKEDKTLTVSAPGLLGNDTDVEGSSLSALLVTGPKHGKITLNADGSFVYKPASNFYGTDSFTYKANDGSADSNVAKVTLTITAVNDRPTDVVLSRNNVAENKPSGTVVGTLSTVDPDEGDTFTYRLVTGLGDADNGKFKIEGNVLKTAAKFNYESKKEYSIRVQSLDKGGLTRDKVLTILVTNVNEGPTNVVLSRNKVAENQPAGTVVGKLSTVDPDEGDTFTYKLVAGLGDEDNGKFKIEGNVLKTAAKFNYEAKKEYSIRIRSTDKGGLTKDKVFAILVTDVNEVLSNSSSSASEIPVETAYAASLANALSIAASTDLSDTFEDSGLIDLSSQYSDYPVSGKKVKTASPSVAWQSDFVTKAGKTDPNGEIAIVL